MAPAEIGSWAGQQVGSQIGAAATNALGGQDQIQKMGLQTAIGGLGDLGSAAGQFVDGQVSSALGAFGVDASPRWLKGIARYVSTIGIRSGGGGSGLFGGGDGGSGGGAANAVAPIAATPSVHAAPAAASIPAGIHAGGGQAPGPAGPTYNIRTATVEDAFLQSQRLEKERSAAKLSRFA